MYLMKHYDKKRAGLRKYLRYVPNKYTSYCPIHGGNNSEYLTLISDVIFAVTFQLLQFLQTLIIKSKVESTEVLFGHFTSISQLHNVKFQNFFKRLIVL